MKMNTRDKMKLAASITRQNYWTQQTLADMNFSQSETPQKENRKKRSIDEVQHMTHGGKDTTSNSTDAFQSGET